MFLSILPIFLEDCSKVSSLSEFMKFNCFWNNLICWKSVKIQNSGFGIRQTMWWAACSSNVVLLCCCCCCESYYTFAMEKMPYFHLTLRLSCSPTCLFNSLFRTSTFHLFFFTKIFLSSILPIFLGDCSKVLSLSVFMKFNCFWNNLICWIRVKIQNSGFGIWNLSNHVMSSMQLKCRIAVLLLLWVIVLYFCDGQNWHIFPWQVTKDKVSSNSPF